MQMSTKVLKNYMKFCNKYNYKPTWEGLKKYWDDI